MEEVTLERKRNPAWFAIPAAGFAAFMLARRIAGGRYEETKDQLLLDESNIDLQGALNIALKYIPGTPVEVELEEEHGMPVWEVEIVPKRGGPTREVIVDARTGDVLEVRAEYPEAA